MSSKYPQNELDSAALEQASREQLWNRLMQLAQDGDADAYGDLLKQLSEVLRGFIGKRVKDQNQMEDLVQEALLGIHTARHTFNPERSFHAWVFSVARYKIFDHLRKSYRRVEVNLTAEAWDNFIQSTKEDNFSEENQTRVQAALGQLPLKQRQAIEMLKLQELSVNQVAKKLSMKPGAVKTMAHRAYKTLRSKIQKPDVYNMESETNKLIQEMQTGLRPVRRFRPRSAILFYLVFISAVTASWLGYWGVRFDLLARLSEPQFVLEMTLLTWIMASGFYFSTLLSVPGNDDKKNLAVGVSLLLFLIWCGLICFDLRSESLSWESLSHSIGWGCVEGVGAVGILGSFFGVGMARLAAPVFPRLNSWLAFISAGALGSFVTQLSCSSLDPMHLATSHFAPAAICGGLGYLIGRTCFR